MHHGPQVSIPANYFQCIYDIWMDKSLRFKVKWLSQFVWFVEANSKSLYTVSCAAFLTRSALIDTLLCVYLKIGYVDWKLFCFVYWSFKCPQFPCSIYRSIFPFVLYIHIHTRQTIDSSINNNPFVFNYGLPRLFAPSSRILGFGSIHCPKFRWWISIIWGISPSYLQESFYHHQLCTYSPTHKSRIRISRFRIVRYQWWWAVHCCWYLYHVHFDLQYRSNPTYIRFISPSCHCWD